MSYTTLSGTSFDLPKQETKGKEDEKDKIAEWLDYCVRDYRAVVKLGKGAFGTVWQACKAEDCNYAIKVQPVGTREEERFLRSEALLLEELGRLEISPRLVSSKVCTGQGFLVQERMDGSCADFFLPDKRLSTLNKTFVVANIFHQLRRIAALGLVHLDLKPANILYSERNGGYVIRIGDLGAVDRSSLPVSAERTETLMNRQLEQLATWIWQL